MGFGQGLSGLNAASQSLDIIGNNIANSGTVGFKAAGASFADVFASSRVGLGTQVAAVNQRFTIGTVKDTGNQFDMAIDGEKGFFRLLDTNGSVLYSRNGEFHANKDNEIVNAQGHRLTGYAVGSGNPTPIKVPTGNIAPQATDRIDLKTNLDANADVVDPATHPFDPTNGDSFTHSQPVDVYDSLGNAHQLVQYFVKRTENANGNSEWDVYYTLDGDSANIAPNMPQSLEFDAAGVLVGNDAVALTITDIGGAASPAEDLEIDLSYAGSTQFGGKFSPSFTQNGYPTGEYASMSIDSDGTIIARYTNGETKPMGTVVLADFKNLQGLDPVGGNAWAETSASGQPVLGAPGTNGLALLKGQSVEESNVDMSEELVNMIIAQRTYQANAQTIKTQDQILQTLITLR